MYTTPAHVPGVVLLPVMFLEWFYSLPCSWNGSTVLPLPIPSLLITPIPPTPLHSWCGNPPLPPPPCVVLAGQCDGVCGVDGIAVINMKPRISL